MLVTGAFMVVEVIGGLLSGSLALLADAGHMLTDTASLALAWVAFRLGRKPADNARSYGYQRFQVLAAFVNGATLLAIVGWITVEAVGRLLNPQPVMGGTMIAVAVLGLIVNLVAFRLLHGGDQHNLNLRGAALHVLGDLLGSVAAIAAAVVILTTGWTPIDPLLSLLVAGLILRSAWMLVRQSGHILLEGTPSHLDIEEIKRELPAAVPAISDVHHVHAWSLTAERPLVTLHANVREGADHGRVLQAIKRHLSERFAVEHSTVQLEPGPCADHERADGCGSADKP
jgi:cobalt-zinc-cadmium efflux system protein